MATEKKSREENPQGKMKAPTPKIQLTEAQTQELMGDGPTLMISGRLVPNKLQKTGTKEAAALKDHRSLINASTECTAETDLENRGLDNETPAVPTGIPPAPTSAAGKPSHPFRTLLIVAGILFGITMYYRVQDTTDKKQEGIEKVKMHEATRIRRLQAVEAAKGRPHSFRFGIWAEESNLSNHPELSISLGEYYVDPTGGIKDLPLELCNPSWGKKDDERYEKFYWSGDLEFDRNLDPKSFYLQYFVTNKAIEFARAELEKLRKRENLPYADKAYAHALEEALSVDFVAKFQDPQNQSRWHYQLVHVPLQRAIQVN